MKKKTIFLLLNILFNYILPSVIILLQFDFFKHTSAGMKFTSIAMVCMFVLIVKFFRQISDWIKSIKNYTVLMVMNIAKTLILCFAILVVLKVMQDAMLDLQIITIIFGLCFSFGSIFHYLRLKEIDREKGIEEETNLRKILNDEFSKLSKNNNN